MDVNLRSAHAASSAALMAAAAMIPIGPAVAQEVRFLLQARVAERCEISDVARISNVRRDTYAIKVDCNVENFSVDIQNAGQAVDFQLVRTSGPARSVSTGDGFIRISARLPGRYLFLIETDEALEQIQNLQIGLSA